MPGGSGRVGADFRRAPRSSQASVWTACPRRSQPAGCGRVWGLQHRLGSAVAGAASQPAGLAVASFAVLFVECSELRAMTLWFRAGVHGARVRVKKPIVADEVRPCALGSVSAPGTAWLVHLTGAAFKRGWRSRCATSVPLSRLHDGGGQRVRARRQPDPARCAHGRERRSRLSRLAGSPPATRRPP
jgi:hypothetical protein